MFRNGVLGGGTWFVELERKITEILTDDPVIWLFFIEVKNGELKVDDLIIIHEKSPCNELLIKRSEYGMKLLY